MGLHSQLRLPFWSDMVANSLGEIVTLNVIEYFISSCMILKMILLGHGGMADVDISSQVFGGRV